jgi:hypothetical protein
LAFTSTIIRKFWRPNEYIVVGTFNCTSPSTGGDIDTSLRTCKHLSLQHCGSSVIPNAPTINENFPCNGRAVSIKCDTDTTGTFIAYGEGT